jgi:hypothetical protein
LAALAGASAGCATYYKHSEELQPDGIYHIKCDAKLQVCLDHAENHCNHERYVVLRAIDVRDLKGVSMVVSGGFSTAEQHTSEAWIRCTGFGAWGDANRELLKTEVGVDSTLRKDASEPKASLHAPAPPRSTAPGEEAPPAPVAPPAPETPPAPPTPPTPPKP